MTDCSTSAPPDQAVHTDIVALLEAHHRTAAPNPALEHLMKPGKNRPVGLILCAEKGRSKAHYALKGQPQKLPAEKLDKTRCEQEARRIAHCSDVEGGV